ncbi:MAG TPA: hypothetical protein VIC84_02490 [Blastocatellia bacterium]|jgi:hypothetical protein
MNESATDPNVGAPCEDCLAWQRLLDEELNPSAAELLLHHLKFCRACAETALRLSHEKSICEEQLGLEDEGEEEFSRQVLARVRLRIEEARQARRPAHFSRRWPQYAAALILALLVIWLSLWRQTGASAEEVLAEAILRERAKAYQPGKVLYWTLESDYINIPTYADGRYRTLSWQSNCDGNLAFITRRYDQENRLTQAFWRKPNGAEVRFVQAGGAVVEITPSNDELRAAAPNLEPALRGALEDYLRRREDGGRRQLQGWNVEWLRKALRTSNHSSTAQLINSPEGGRIYHLRAEMAYKPSPGGFVRVVSEDDIDANTYQRLRVKNTRYRADGAFAIDDTRYSAMKEVSLAEFDANNLNDLIGKSKNIVRLSPTEIARRELMEARTRMISEKP